MGAYPNYNEEEEERRYYRRKRLGVLKNVLAASSAYLKSLVVHDNLLNLDHDMVSPAVFRLVLDFIYTGRLADGAEAAAAAAVAPGAEPSLGAVLS